MKSPLIEVESALMNLFFIPSWWKLFRRHQEKRNMSSFFPTSKWNSFENDSIFLKSSLLKLKLKPSFVCLISTDWCSFVQFDYVSSLTWSFSSQSGLMTMTMQLPLWMWQTNKRFNYFVGDRFGDFSIWQLGSLNIKLGCFGSLALVT